MMTIVNRRNAVLGYVVWRVVKRTGKQKAREAVPGPGDYAGLNKSAIASIAAAATGAALVVWRKKSGEPATE
jgi:ABC-type Co2+ transport system permease subunit